MLEYLTANLWMLWLSISIICLIIELSSGDFYVTCFAIGALCSMISSFFGAPLWLQIVIWAICSVLCIVFVRPSLLRKFHQGGEERVSNADALIGRRGTVIEDIPTDGHGYIKVDGDEWRSISEDNTPIAKGSTVEIVSRDSIVMTVRAIE